MRCLASENCWPIPSVRASRAGGTSSSQRVTNYSALAGDSSNVSLVEWAAMVRAILLTSLLPVLVGAADFTVGSATAGRGQKATGYIAVPTGVDAAASIPVIVVNGARPGPVLALVAGSHGTEYASILALQKLAQAADPAELSGTLIILPLINVPSFAQKVSHLNPVDGKNMNRFYPGRPDGTQTERVSWAIAKQVVEKCDYLIDLHAAIWTRTCGDTPIWPRLGTSRRTQRRAPWCWPLGSTTSSCRTSGPRLHPAAP